MEKKQNKYTNDSTCKEKHAIKKIKRIKGRNTYWETITLMNMLVYQERSTIINTEWSLPAKGWRKILKNI